MQLCYPPDCLAKFVVNGFISLFSKIVVQAWKCDGFSVRSAKFLLVFSHRKEVSRSFFSTALEAFQYFINIIFAILLKGGIFQLGHRVANWVMLPSFSRISSVLKMPLLTVNISRIIVHNQNLASWRVVGESNKFFIWSFFLFFETGALSMKLILSRPSPQ